MKYSYWAICPECKVEFHVYKSVNPPAHTGTIDGRFSVIEICPICSGLVKIEDTSEVTK